MVSSIAWSASSSSSNDLALADKEICVRELINAAGRQKESLGIDMKVGKMAKKMLLADNLTSCSLRSKSTRTGS